MKISLPFKSASKTSVSAFFNWLYFGLFLVLLFVFLQQLLPYTISDSLWPDEALYAWIAQRIAQNPLVIFSPEVTAYHPPLFPMILSFFPDGLYALKAFSLFISFLGLVAVFLLGKKMENAFTGLLCSLLLVFDQSYFLGSIRILPDSFLMSLFVIFALLFMRAVENDKSWQHYSIGTCAGLIVSIKWSGLLVVPLLVCAYLGGFKDYPVRQRLNLLKIPLTIVLVFILFNLSNNLIQLGTLLPNLSAIQGVNFVNPFGYYIKLLGEDYLFLAPFFFFGLFLFMRKENYKILFLVWFFLFLVVLSSVGEKDPRYSSLFMPPMILAMSMGVNEVLRLLFKNVILMNLVRISSIILLLWLYLPQSFLYMKSIHKKSQSYVGFQEAGQWLKDNAQQGALILADSRRALRYCSGINFKEYGGILESLPKDKNSFDKLIMNNSRRPIVLIVDTWEFTQPKWIYPMTIDKQNAIEKLGFRPAEIIYKHFSNMKPSVPVVKIWVMNEDSNPL